MRKGNSLILVLAIVMGLGAAYLAGLATGVFGDLDAVAKAHHVQRTFDPTMTGEDRAAHLARWRDAVRRARSETGVL